MAGRSRQIALAFPMAPGHNQQLFEGIAEYARKKANWLLSAGPETFSMSISELHGWRGDGVIALINTKRQEAQAAALGVPVVDISAAMLATRFPRVTNDHRVIGRIAAEHLLSRGLWRFAYYGVRGVWYSQERGHGFIDRLKQEDCEVHQWQARSSIRRGVGWHDWIRELEGWLARIEPPLGVFAVHDNRARMLMDVCRQMGLHVPHDVAVVGVNNDPLTCEFGQPTLTSIDRNSQLCGYKAASLLDELMSTRHAAPENLIIPPGALIARESTDLLAVDDPDLNMAVHFMRSNFSKGIDISHVLANVSLSRRWLENRFKRYFGCTPHEFLCEVRVEHAKQLIIGQKHLTLAAVARECGFGSVRQLREVFHRLTRTTPREYRLIHRQRLQDDASL
ncbi:MAG TPA: hypothetical protein DD670_01915 [Planctomycetaceae bacterium]|nr:hypothetical protein [Planctomycetaceae bacterium]